MREHFTKRYIAEALFELLKVKTIQEITIKELVKKAGVSKASFYRNYLDINNVITEYLDGVFGNLYQVCPIDPSDMEVSIRTILEHIYMHREVILILSRNHLLGNLDRYLYDCTLEEITKHNVLDNRYQPYFFTGATVGFISGWIKYGFVDSSEAMAQYFIRSLHGYMNFH